MLERNNSKEGSLAILKQLVWVNSSIGHVWQILHLSILHLPDPVSYAQEFSAIEREMWPIARQKAHIHIAIGIRQEADVKLVCCGVSPQLNQTALIREATEKDHRRLLDRLVCATAAPTAASATLAPTTSLCNC